MKAAAAAAVVATALVVIVLEAKSVEYGLPVSALMQGETARLWVYESLTGEGLLAPRPQFVKVRWARGVADTDRAAAERRYGLEPVEARPERTWVYRLTNFDHASVRALLNDSRVDDVEGFDRRGFVEPAEPLVAAVERAILFALPQAFIEVAPRTWRPHLVGAVRRLSDPILQWTVFAALAALAMMRWAGPPAVSAPALLPTPHRVVRELFLGVPSGRTLRHATAWMIAVAVAVVLTAPWTRFAAPTITNAPFAVRAIDLAVTRALCGTTSSVAPASPGLELLRDESLRRRPIPDVVRALAGGSLQAYCASAAPFRNPENSPMLLMTGALLWVPQLSADALGWYMQAVKLVIIGATAYMYLVMGIGVGATYVLTLAAVHVVQPLGTYVQYSLLGISLAFVATAWVFVQRPAAPRTAPYERAAAAMLGVATGFAAHVRSSHVPIYLALLLLYVALAAPRGPARPALAAYARWVGTALAAFAFGYLAFTRTFIAPIERATEDAANYTSHAVAHPLVLALSLSSPEALADPGTVPGSNLARREGITFEDDRGITLARRVDPSVEYLSPTYERALWAYYWDLWRRHPGEMAGIYAAKFQLADAGIRQYLRGDDRGWVLGTVGRLLDRTWPAGVPVFWLYAVVLVTALTVHRRKRSSAACLLAFFSVVAMLVYLEQVAVVPSFEISYFNFVPMYFVALAALGAQALLASVAERIGWTWTAA